MFMISRVFVWMFWLLTGMQGKKHVWLLNLMNLFVGVRLSIVSFFLLVFQSFPWRDQNFWASNGNFCTLDNLSCGAQFPNFLGRMTGFLGCFATPMAQACISGMFSQACQVSVSYSLRNVGRALGGSYKCNAVNLLSIHARHTHTHTHNSISEAAFARASKSTVRLRQKTVHPTAAPSVEQLPPQPRQQLQRQRTQVRRLPQLPRPQHQVLLWVCSCVYVIGSPTDHEGRR